MPWKPDDAPRHTRKAKSKKAKEQWSAVANNVLGMGGSEGAAIRQANAVVSKRKPKKPSAKRR